jgi:hypothetical protein
MNDCWELPSNTHKRPAYFAASLEEEDVVDDESITADVLGQNNEGRIGTAD